MKHTKGQKILSLWTRFDVTLSRFILKGFNLHLRVYIVYTFIVKGRNWKNPFSYMRRTHQAFRMDGAEELALALASLKFNLTSFSQLHQKCLPSNFVCHRGRDC